MITAFIIVIISITFLLSTVYAYPQKGPAIPGTVTKIIDGDTIDAKLANNETVRIRFTLADTPERGEPGWREATAYTKAKCPVGSIIIMDPDSGQGKSYKRNVAKVFCNNMLLINDALVDNGYGDINQTRYCARTEFKTENWTGCN